MVVIMINSCKKDDRSPLSKDNTAPDPIKNTQVTNLVGAALITYTLPDNENLLYVKAVYTLNGQTERSKSIYVPEKAVGRRVWQYRRKSD